MPIRYFVLSVLLLLCLCSVSAQKIELYTKLDSIKAKQKTSLARMEAQHLSKDAVNAVRDYYKDVRDSVRDLAHDCADSIIEHMDRFSHLELGLDMMSNQYYFGRRGPAAGVEGDPSLKYFNKTGLYAMFTADIYDIKYSLIKPTKTGKLDTVAGQKAESDLTFTAGWARTFFDKWDLEAYYDPTLIFYGTDKNLLSNTVDLNTAFDFWNCITAKVEYEFLFGGASKDPIKKKTSSFFLFDLYKDFKIYRLPGAAVLSIGPEIQSYVGNDNLARSRVIARNRHGGVEVPELYDNFFGLMDIEAGVNIEYRIKNLGLSFTPLVAIPFNEIPTTLPPTITQASQLSQYRQNQMQPLIFYATVGVKYYFKFWKERSKKHQNLNK